MKAAGHPWMKFYPSDWRADPALRSCTIAARGLWIEMLCLMHEAEPYGSLLVKGQAIDKKRLASLCGILERECAVLLLELEGFGVFERDIDGTIYSRRMRRDRAKAEQDKRNGRGGGNPNITVPVNQPVKPWVNGGVNPQLNGGDKAHIPEARSQTPEKKTRTAKAVHAYDEKFEEAWQGYPRRDGGNPKPPAAKLFLAALKSGEDAQAIIDGVKRFALAENRNVGTPYIPQMVKWLRDRRWLDYGPTAEVLKFDVRKHLV